MMSNLDFSRILLITFTSLVILVTAFVVPVFGQVTAPQNTQSSTSTLIIPLSLKTIAGEWYNNKISDSDFLQSVQYFLNQGTMVIPDIQTNSNSSSTTAPIPNWIKSTAGLWSRSEIRDDNFVNGIEYLFADGYLPVHVDGVPNTISQLQSEDVQPTTPSNQSPLISVMTIKNYYVTGESIQIYGKAKNFVGGSPVMIQIFNPNNRLIQTLQTNVQYDGYYYATLTIDTTWKPSGNYTAQVQYSIPNVSAKTIFYLNATIQNQKISIPTLPNSMSSSHLGLKEHQWVKYQITGLSVSASDPLVEAQIKSGIMDMFAIKGIDSSYVSTEWIKYTVMKATETKSTIDTIVGLSNGTEKDAGEQIFDPQNYTGAPKAIPIDLEVGDVVPVSMDSEPLKVDKIENIQIAGKNLEAYELTSTTSRFGSWGSTENDQHAFYDKNTGILLAYSFSLSSSGTYSIKMDMTFNAVDFSDDLLKSNTNNGKSYPSIQSSQTSQSTSTSVFTLTPQDIQNINQAKASQTIAAEVNVGVDKTEIKLIDNNVSVHTTQNTPDSLSVQVSATGQTSPKIIAFNLNTNTINVQNLKDLDVMYDGKLVQSASNMDTILHAKSTDDPSFAIVVTQSGVQVLVLVPHFSTHSITITNMSKVIPAVPEFPISLLVLLIAIGSTVLFYRINPIKH